MYIYIYIYIYIHDLPGQGPSSSTQRGSRDGTGAVTKASPGPCNCPARPQRWSSRWWLAGTRVGAGCAVAQPRTKAEDLFTNAVPEKMGDVKLPQRYSQLLLPRLSPGAVIPGCPAGLRQGWAERGSLDLRSGERQQSQGLHSGPGSIGAQQQSWSEFFLQVPLGNAVVLHKVFSWKHIA